MDDRISRHRAQRPTGWHTVEEGRNVDAVLDSLQSSFDVVIIDCLTNLVSNLLLQGLDSTAIEKRIDGLMTAARRAPFATILVANEVGCGVVPETALGRQFRDVAGIANQLAAQYVDEIYLMTAGIPLRLKPH
jgi:adenosylcobinamide kinase/adenosylcobinamide-phosphate guanylyltransferase